MIKDIKNSILALEVLGIPEKIKDLENRPSVMGPRGPKGADGTGGGTGLLVEDTVAPVGQVNGYFSVVDDIMYYFTGGNRYKLTATLDNPVSQPIETGNPMGLWLPFYRTYQL
jgi:hypothetical protein